MSSDSTLLTAAMAVAPNEVLRRYNHNLLLIHQILYATYTQNNVPEQLAKLLKTRHEGYKIEHLRSAAGTLVELIDHMGLPLWVTQRSPKKRLDALAVTNERVSNSKLVDLLNQLPTMESP